MDLRRWLIRLGEDDAAFGPLPGTRCRHRWLAMGFIIVFHRQSHPFPDTDLRALLDGLRDNQSALTAHIVALGLEERRLSSSSREQRRVHDPLGVFGAKEIDQLAEELVGWARARANDGNLVRSLRDADQIEALRLADAIDTDLRARIWSEVGDDPALDHLVDLFFGDEPQEGAPASFGHLFEETAAIRDRLIARDLAYGELEPPAALRAALDAMETRARFLASAAPRSDDPAHPTGGESGG